MKSLGLRVLGGCLAALLVCGCSSNRGAKAQAPAAAPPVFAGVSDQREDESALLQPVEVTQAFASRQQEFQACFERDHELTDRSKIVVSFLVSGRGSVDGVQPVSESVHNPEVVRCVVGVVEGLKFRETPGGATRILFTIAYNNG